MHFVGLTTWGGNSINQISSIVHTSFGLAVTYSRVLHARRDEFSESEPSKLGGYDLGERLIREPGKVDIGFITD